MLKMSTVVCGALLLLCAISVLGQTEDGINVTDSRRELSHALVFDAEDFLSEMERKRHFVLIYTPGSAETRHLEEIFDRLAVKFNTMESMERIVLAKVNCDEVSELCNEIYTGGNATMALVSENGSLQSVYSGIHDYESVNGFLEASLDFYKEQEQEVLVPRPKKTLLELTENDFDETTSVGHHFVKFYAPWCGHCQRLAPVWEQLVETFEHEDWLSIGKVDCSQHGSLCSKNGVRGYPTLVYFIDGRKIEEYNGARDHGSLKNYVLKHRPLYRTGNSFGSAEEEYTDEGIPIRDYVLPLSDETFLPEISKGTNFVMFYDPECVHCKTLSPDWISLALAFIKDEITFSKLDCTKYAEICTQQSVHSLPTLVFFKEGKRMEKYDGMLRFHLLKEFVMHMKTLSPPDDLPPEEPSFVVDLNSSNFDDCMEDGFCFINFFKPWCDFCKNLAPIWEDLATKFSDEESVTVARVDCSVSSVICTQRGVEHFPTILLFHRGQQKGFYTGPHDLESLYDYVSSYLQHTEL